MKEVIRCNLCGSNDSEVILIEGGLDIVRCKNCGFIYTKTLPEKVWENPETPKINIEKMQVYNQILNQLQIKHKNGKLLDVGCGTGCFVLMARKRGFECIGLEHSKRFSEFASNLGLNVLNTTLIDICFPNRFFDLTSYLEVFEHISKPSEELEEVHRILKDDGLLVIEIPNVTFQLFKAKVFKCFGINYYGLMPFTHLVHFSEKTITRMLEKNGFRIVKILVRDIAISKKEPMLFRIFLVLFNYLSKLIKRILNFNIGNAMIIIAEKDKTKMTANNSK